MAVGCAAPMVPSQQLHHHLGRKMHGAPAHLGGHRFSRQDTSDCDSCGERQRLQDYAHCVAPYVAGPFAHHGASNLVAAEQPTIKPPHSRFHPVPTRPVFETRATYLPPQPMGVQLVPIPDGGVYSLGPILQQPHEIIGPAPAPPRMLAEPLRSNAMNEADTFMLPPPSE